VSVAEVEDVVVRRFEEIFDRQVIDATLSRSV